MDDSMFETWLCSYPSIYPGDEEFGNLAGLTRLSLDTVRLWFTEKLRCKTSTAPLNNVLTAARCSGIGASSSRYYALPAMNTPQQPSILQRAALWVKREREPKCIASLDQSVLLRDDNKPFQCTRKCGKKFRDRDDWRKHEEVNWPQEGWVCDLPVTVLVAGIHICTHCGVPNPDMDHFQTHKKSTCNSEAFTTRGRLHHRKQHFFQHFDNVHPHVPCDDYLRNSHFIVESNFPRWCGFCSHTFVHWKDRVEHIGIHFHEEGKDTTEWNDHMEGDHEMSNQEDDRHDDDDEDNDDASDSSDEDSDDSPPRSGPKRHDQSKAARPKGQRGITMTNSRNRMLQLHLAIFDTSVEAERLFTPTDRNSVKQPPRPRSLSPTDDLAGNLRYGVAKFLDTLETPPYARVRVLGYGPYSVVDEVRNLATGAVFARKTTTFPKQREQSSFMTEIEIMKKLDHPHILRFVDAYTLDNSVSILMSPVPDFDLDYLMSKHPTAEPIPVDTITQWFTCLASSVKYLHENSIKHQDIKPSNILIKGQTVFLADFGTAKTFVDSNSTVSTSGDMTMKYCSPETALQGMRGRKADIFSLGCVFLEMFNLLIPQGYSKFEHFQDCHSIGGGTYHESLLMVELWVGDLRREPIFEAGSILRQLLHTCQGMLRESRKDRPSAADLSASLPLGKCCLLAENEADSKPTLQEKRTSSSMPRPLFHNSPQSAHLDHQIPTASEQASQRKPSSKRGCDSLSPQITLKSAILEVAHPKKNHWWSSWSLILESIGCNYIPMLLLILTSCSWFLYLPPTPSLRKARGHAPPRSISSAKFESRQSELTELLSYSEDTAIPTAFLGARTILQRLSIATASQPEIPLVRPSSDISYKIHFSGPAVQGKTFDRIEQSWLENTDYDEAAADLSMQILASQGILLTNYWDVIHPSELNYMAVAYTDYFGTESNDPYSAPPGLSSIVDLLNMKGISWGEYQDLPCSGFLGYGLHDQQSLLQDYIRKHNPLILFDYISSNVTRSSLVNDDVSFNSDMAPETLHLRALSQWAFITPSMPDDSDVTINDEFFSKAFSCFMAKYQHTFWMLRNKTFTLNDRYGGQMTLDNLTLTRPGREQMCGHQTWHWDIGPRLSPWLIPILLLISNIHLLPLDKGRFAAIIHLLGDPIDSFWSLIYKLYSWEQCYYFAKKFAPNPRVERRRRIIATIFAAYEEIEGPEITLEEYFTALAERSGVNDLEKFVEWTRTAIELADSRTNECLRTWLAISLYVCQIIASFVPDIGGGNTSPSGGRIGTAMLISWLVPAVLLSNAIGSFTSPQSCYDIVNRFAKRTKNPFPPLLRRRSSLFRGRNIQGSRSDHFEALPWSRGIYTFRPWKTRFLTGKSNWSKIALMLFFATLLLCIGMTGGFIIVWYTIPNGLNCRNFWMIGIFLAWFISAFVTWIFHITNFLIGKYHRRFVLFKDALIAIPSMLVIFLSNSGLFNWCFCWCGYFHYGKWARVTSNTNSLYEVNDRTLYPGVVAVTLLLQICCFAVVPWWWRRGVRLVRWGEGAKHHEAE